MSLQVSVAASWLLLLPGKATLSLKTDASCFKLLPFAAGAESGGQRDL